MHIFSVQSVLIGYWKSFCVVTMMRRRRRCQHCLWRRVFSIFIRPTTLAAIREPWQDEKRKRTKRTCYTTEWEGKNTFRSGRPCLAVPSVRPSSSARKAYAVTRRVIKLFFFCCCCVKNIVKARKCARRPWP